MHKVKKQRYEEWFIKNHIKNMAICYFYMVIIKTCKVKKNSLTNFRKDWIIGVHRRL